MCKMYHAERHKKAQLPLQLSPPGPVSISAALTNVESVGFWTPVWWVCGCLLTAAHASLVHLVKLEGWSFLFFHGLDKLVAWPLIKKQLTNRPILVSNEMSTSLSPRVEGMHAESYEKA
jgi:hypothetical protein